MKFSVYMRLEKETKGALQYKEVDDNDKEVPFNKAQIGTLYVRKNKMKEFPDLIKVIVKAVDE